MSRPDESTLRAMNGPTVLAIGFPRELSARCAQAVETLGAVLADADVVGAPTAAAEQRPLAIVLLEDLYAFDPAQFDALARDVQASLVRVEEDISAAKLELILHAAIDAAIERRHAPPSAPRAAPPPPPQRRPERLTGSRRPSFSDFEVPPSSRE